MMSRVLTEMAPGAVQRAGAEYEAIAFYAAAEVNGAGNTGAYQLDDVSVVYRPAGHAAKTECVDPTMADAASVLSGNLVRNPWIDDLQHWQVGGALVASVEDGVLRFHRTTDPTPPVIAHLLGTTWGGEYTQTTVGQRLSATFELGNTSPTRQRVTVSLQEADGSTFQSCVFWLAPGSPRRHYAMRIAAPAAWANMALTVFPNASGTAATHGWLELDTVLALKTPDPVVGTECLEPGSFALGEWGASTPTLPMPDPAPVVEAVPAPAWVPVPEMPAAGPSAIPAAPLTVTIAGTGRGTIASSAAGAICTGVEVSCTTLVPDGQTVTLTATPVAGQAFAGWGGACTGTQPCTVFINGPQTVVATFNAAATISYYHTDVLGSVRAITDAVGGVLARHDYFPFGESTAPLAGDPRRFTGKERDAETALDYLDARYYRNVWGRFTTADDSIFMDTADPQTFNRYAYVFNNPLRWVDPSGHQAQPPLRFTDAVTVTATAPSDCFVLCEPEENGALTLTFALQNRELYRLGRGRLPLGEMADQVWAFLDSPAGELLAGLPPARSLRLLGSGLRLGVRFAAANFAKGQLKGHFRRHAAEWGVGNLTVAGYLKRARSLLDSPTGGDILGLTRPNGDVLRYNIRTNEFAVGTADGRIMTLFRPKDGLDYWLRQAR